jgi:hypothetical protein
MLLGSVSHADDDRHRKQYRSQHSVERSHSWHRPGARHQSRHEPRRHEPRRHEPHRHAPVHRRDAHWYRANGWRQHDGRYWAPASHRGRYCTDRRHHGGAHYHVAVRDYYDYYYPRYRHHGVLPLISSASASVIISVPLF